LFFHLIIFFAPQKKPDFRLPQITENLINYPDKEIELGADDKLSV